MKPKFLATKLALVLAVSSAFVSPSQAAGIPVLVDGGVNTANTIVATMEDVAQTLKQIEE